MKILISGTMIDGWQRWIIETGGDFPVDGTADEQLDYLNATKVEFVEHIETGDYGFEIDTIEGPVEVIQ